MYNFQDFSYSVFSIIAIVIHLIINYDLFKGRKLGSDRAQCYCGFLIATLVYYIADAAWGIFAELGWRWLWYADTVFFFLSLPYFAFMWCRFLVVYLGLGKLPTRVLTWFGYVLLAVNVVAMVANSFNNCIFYFDPNGNYVTTPLRDHAFYLLVAFYLLIAGFVFAKAMRCGGSVRRRNMMVFHFCLVMAAAIILQVIWPLTPFTALGCLIGNCFLHIFVVEDAQTAQHMAELEKALERARTAEKSRSMFFSIVSHDIRTPLNAILGYSELLQNGIKDESAKAEALESIRASGTTLLQLVNDVLDIAKMDSGKITLHPEPFQLSRLTDDVFASFRLAASEKGLDLVNNTYNVSQVMLDGHRFRQILFNLVGNAIKFTERGSVTVSASFSGKDLECSVTDTGCGIPTEMLTRILDPFFQIEDPTHIVDRSMGTGLGLSICKGIVDAMGGKLTVQSEPWKGSTFKIDIPGVVLEGVKTFQTADPKQASPTMNLPKHVLVVDDSPVNRSVLKAFLKRAGVPSTGYAGDGREALAELRSALKAGEPYDFVFSDFWMPNMNGLEFIEKFRVDPRFCDIPVVAVTADSEFRKESRSKLFNGVLMKPLTYDKLMEVFATI